MGISKTTKFTEGVNGLLIPANDPEHEPLISLDYAEYVEWFKNLPLAYTDETAKMLFVAFTEINKSKIPPLEKFALAETSRKALHYTALGLKKYYIDHTKELSTNKLKIAELAQTLHLEFSFIYKQVVDYIITNKVNNTTVLNTALYRAIYFSMLIIFRSYQIYSVQPAHIWREVGILYELAKEHKLEHISIGTEYRANAIPFTIESCFKHIMILAASNPYQWRTHDQENIHIAISQWNEFVVLRKIKHEDINTSYVYAYQQEMNQHPLVITENNYDKLNNAWVIDLSELLNELKKLANARTDLNNVLIDAIHVAQSYLSERIIQKLIEHWGKKEIINLRKTENVAYLTAFGLSASHFHISDRDIFDASKNNLSADTNSENLTLENQSTDDFQNDLLSNIKNKIKNEYFPLHLCFLAQAETIYQEITHISSAHPSIQAGDIIALADIRDKEPIWQIAEIKSLKYVKSDNLSILIKKILDDHTITPVSAVSLKNEDDLHIPDMLLRCLIVQQKNQSLLITPSIPFKTDQKVYIRFKNGTNTIIKLVEKISNNASFTLFKFLAKNKAMPEIKPEDLNKENENAEKKIDVRQLPYDFDSVWDKN